jgi:exodeoxyribonuclease-5
MEDYADISQKKERYKRLREDPHFNALQIKYAYAVTCHKAQGGQWSAIYLDQGFLPPDTSATDYYRWLYTAFTRATEQVYLVNWPTAEEK